MLTWEEGRHMNRFPTFAALAAGALGFTGVYALSSGEPLISAPVQAQLASCDIKGNISIDSGEHIYHVPGQSYYASTRIRPEYGERWFCSEAEARAAGWRRSRV
jgi:hypothetical protein